MYMPQRPISLFLLCMRGRASFVYSMLLCSLLCACDTRTCLIYPVGRVTGDLCVLVQDGPWGNNDGGRGYIDDDQNAWTQPWKP